MELTPQEADRLDRYNKKLASNNNEFDVFSDKELQDFVNLLGRKIKFAAC